MLTKNYFLVLSLILFMIIAGCENSNKVTPAKTNRETEETGGNQNSVEKKAVPVKVNEKTEEIVEKQNSPDEETESKISYKVTFVELGSVNCIP